MSTLTQPLIVVKSDGRTAVYRDEPHATPLADLVDRTIQGGRVERYGEGAEALSLTMEIHYGASIPV